MAIEFKNVPFSVKQIVKMIDKETIIFDYPIQRSDGQWKIDQKSLLIDSLIKNYPIPAVYFVGDKEEITITKGGKEVSDLVTVRTTLDGKQRMTNFYSYVKGEYALSKDMKPVVIDAQEYEIANKTFEELDEEVQDNILSRTITSYTVEGDIVTDEEIADLLFRLNNGVPMTTQQKSKALMGLKWAEKINDLGEHILIHNLAAFSKSQIRTEAHITALIQTMMMLDGKYEYINVSQKVISEYSQTFQDDPEYKETLIEKVKEAMDYLSNILGKKEKLLLKKVHFPMTLITALEAKQKGIQEEEFFEWLTYFKSALKEEEGSEIEIPTNYLEYTGSGTVDKVKAIGRMNEMKRHMNEYFNKKEVLQ
ncbi:DUF262 domain-containing protein [Cytobacillus sp. FSL M8-0252]|uniref:DUF262 domain-containing protein n=1 Tax=Cytobacillus sp. FSL M8-0252 TaxID=2921621 RepID=UPI0030FABF95